MAKWQTAVIPVESEEEWRGLFDEVWFVPAIVRILANLGRGGIRRVYIIAPESVKNLHACNSIIEKGKRIQYLPTWTILPEMPELDEPFLIVSPNYLWHPELIDWFENATGLQYSACAIPGDKSGTVIREVTPYFPQDSNCPVELKIPEQIPCIPIEEIKKDPKKLISLAGKPTDRPHVVAVRHLLFPFLTFCARKNIHPDQITWLGFWVHIAGCLILLVPGYLTGITAALILILSWILDCADGTLARLTHRESKAGQVLDTRLGNLSNFAFFAALLLRTYPPLNFANLFVTILLIGGIFIAGYLHSLIEKLPPSQKMSRYGFFIKINHRDYAFVVLVFALFNALPVFVWLALVGTYCYAFAEFFALVKQKG